DEVAEEGEHHPEDHRAECGAEHRRRAAEQQDRPEEEGQRRRVTPRDDRRGEDEDDAAEGADDPAQHQCLHLEGEDVLAERAHRVLVLSDALEHPAPGAAHERPDEDDDDRQHDQAEHAVPQVRLVVRPRAEAVGAGRERVDLPESGAVAGEASGRVRPLLEQLGEEEEPDDLGGRDRRDREVVGPQTQRRDAEDERERGAGEKADEHAQPPGEAEAQHRDRIAVAADGHERRHAEVQQARVAEVHRETCRGQRIGDRDRAEQVGGGVAEDGSEVHASAQPFLASEESLRSHQEDHDQRDQGARVLEVGGDPQGRHLDGDPHDEGADERADRGAETAERDRAEHQEQHLHAHVPLHPGAEVGPEDAGEGGQHAGDDPDDP
ncbi:hypothetical protein ABE10_02580, partial [Bacillus toyonensis]|nr:hypothetical protein [Bacillus toyonensis]